MTYLLPAIEVFHFIRPLWLLLLPFVFACWFYARRHAGASSVPEAGIAPHLRRALTIDFTQRRAIAPIDGAAIVLSLALIGAAGPTWSRVPDPFVAQTAPLVVVLKVTPSMIGNDVKPSRLERAKQKIRDLLQLRTGARTALVAYSGTVHTVLPMTEDPNVMLPYLEGLNVDVMPKEEMTLLRRSVRQSHWSLSKIPRVAFCSWLTRSHHLTSTRSRPTKRSLSPCFRYCRQAFPIREATH